MVMLLMMIRVGAVSLLVSSAVAFTVRPFVKPSGAGLLQATSTDSENDRIVKVGGGVPVVPSGDNLLFDPNKEGMWGNTADRIAQGMNYEFGTKSGVMIDDVKTDSPPKDMIDAQHWLEDMALPLNFAKPTNPVIATVLGRTRLIGNDAPGDIQHILMKLPEGMHYIEGQSLSVIPPGLDDKGKPHKPRLYSIASTRYGDLLDGTTISLCVRRAEYYDPVTKIKDDSKKGVCSNFLCDMQPGTRVQVAGPVGKTMLLPEDSSKDIIMVATGTGIAPFRGFMHRLFMEHTVAGHMFTGQAWLILGVPTTSGMLYKPEFDAMLRNTAERPEALKIDYAISREQTNSIDGGKMYVQHVLAQQADALLEKLDNGAHIYFCGLKGMMPGILESLEKVCQERGLDFAQKQKEWKSQWHVEVY